MLQKKFVALGLSFLSFFITICMALSYTGLGHGNSPNFCALARASHWRGAPHIAWFFDTICWTTDLISVVIFFAGIALSLIGSIVLWFHWEAGKRVLINSIWAYLISSSVMGFTVFLWELYKFIIGAETLLPWPLVYLVPIFLIYLNLRGARKLNQNISTSTP